MSDIVDRIESVIKDIEREHPLSFAALVMPADSESSSYDLIISSPWFSQEGRLKSYNYLKDKLSKQLNKEDWKDFNRILLLKPEDKFIQELTDIVNRFKNRDFANLIPGPAGVDLRFAHIFAAHSKGSSMQ